MTFDCLPPTAGLLDTGAHNQKSEEHSSDYVPHSGGGPSVRDAENSADQNRGDPEQIRGATAWARTSTLDAPTGALPEATWSQVRKGRQAHHRPRPSLRQRCSVLGLMFQRSASSFSFIIIIMSGQGVCPCPACRCPYLSERRGVPQGVGLTRLGNSTTSHINGLQCSRAVQPSKPHECGFVRGSVR